MKKGDLIHGYRILEDFRVVGGMSKVTFAERGGNEYFIKEFLSPKYPTPDSPGSEKIKAQKRKACDAFEAHHRKINKLISTKVSFGGNLVYAVAFFRDGASYYKVNEKVEIASLSPKDISELSGKEILSIVQSVCHSVGILHDLKIVHGDLKPENILIQETSKGRYLGKLIDFDDSYFSENPPKDKESIVGTPEYYSPELAEYIMDEDKEIEGKTLTLASDIFTLGIIFCEFFTGEKPISGTTLPVWEAVKKGFPIEFAKEINLDIADMIREMLSYSPPIRPSIKKIQHTLKDILNGKTSHSPVIKNFSCESNANIAIRDTEYVFSWQIENASEVSIDSIHIPFTQTTYKRAFTEDTDITLAISNGIRKIERSLHITVKDRPSIDFNVDKNILKKTDDVIETATLNWKVSNARSVEIRANGEKLLSEAFASSLVIRPKLDTEYELIVIGLDNKTEFRSTVNLIVREPARIEFQSDKLFTLPEVPITITWNVHGAKNVKLNGTSVGINGQTSFTPTKDEQYVLSYEDEFGPSSSEIKVRMLPLPIIESVLVDTPNINNAVGIQYSSPQFIEIPSLPEIESTFANLTIPDIPTLKENGLFVELPETPKLNFSNKFSRLLRTIFK